MSQTSNRLPSVLFLDQPFAAGMVHLWLREYFLGKGFIILGGELPPWKENLLLVDHDDKSNDDYLSELDWDEMIRHTVARLNGRYGYNLETGPDKAKIIHCFKSYAKKMEQNFANDNVKVVVIFGNYRIETKLGAYFSHKYQAQLICIESFFLQNYFYLEANSTQIANHHGFIQKWPFVRNLKVTPTQLDELDDLMRQRERHGLLSDYIAMPLATKSLSGKLQKIKQAKGKVGLLLGQMPYDAVIVNDLQAFPSQILFLRFVIEQFIAQSTADDLIVCRLHPLEARYGDNTAKLLQQLYSEHPQVLLLSGDDCNTYQLMDIVDFGIVANSQSGLEMIYRDKPVLVCGNPYYAVEQFCLQATDQETIQVQLGKLLHGWCPSKNKLQVAKQYLCGLIFNHLCRRNKEDVWQRLDHIDSIRHLQNHNTAKLIKQNEQQELRILPNGKVGQVKLNIPNETFTQKSVLVIGAGTFAQYLVSSIEMDVTLCSDVPADCQMFIQQHPVKPLVPSLILDHELILICWPEDKCQQFLSDIGAQTVQNKSVYRVDKIQQENSCEFSLSLIE